MAAHVDPLVIGRVIGDVVDLFVPTVPMSVRFGTRDLTNGCEITPSIATAPPAVQIGGRASDLFTLVSTVLIHRCQTLQSGPMRALSWVKLCMVVVIDCCTVFLSVIR